MQSNRFLSFICLDIHIDITRGLFYITRMRVNMLVCLLVFLGQMSHAAVSTLCRSIKLQCELYSSRQIAICLDPYCGLGFVLWCLSRWLS